MEKKEFVREETKKKYQQYNFSIPFEKLKWSGDIIETTLNDDSVDVVDRLVEFTLCKINAAYYIDRYGYTFPAKGGPIPFKLFDFQQESLDAFQTNSKVIFKKSRQVGASVISGAYALWRANFYQGELIKIISLTRSDATEFKEKTIDLNYEMMPGFLKAQTTRDGNSKTKMKMVNKSQIQVLAKSKNAGRGGTPSLVIIDEAAFNEWMADIWKSIEPSLDKGGDCIVISTTNGVGNWYHTTYTRAEHGENEFEPIYIPWWRYPNRSNPWLSELMDKIRNGEYNDDEVDKFVKVKQKEQLSYKGPPKDAPWLWKRYSNAESDREFRQEILAEFLGSGDTFIEFEKLLELDGMKIKPKWKNSLPNDNIINGLWCWNDVDHESMYMLTADTATGHGKDYSTFHIVDVYSKEQVAEFRAQIATDTFGEVIKKVARYYNNAYVVIECNHPGPATFNEVYKHKKDPYNNVYIRMKAGEPWGWDTTARSRVLLMDALHKDIKNGSTVIKSERLIEEIKMFIWDNNKPQAIKGGNDDLVMAYAIYAHLLDQVYSSRPAPIHTQKKSVDYGNMDADEVDWELKEEQFMERYGVTMEEWYWMQEKELPQGYIEWKRKQEEEQDNIVREETGEAEEPISMGPPLISS